MSEANDMFVVRVNHRNGGIMNYLYLDVGRAKQCAEELAVAKMRFAEQKPAQQHQAHIFDDAGRECWIDGGQIMAVSLIDATREVYMNTRLAVSVQRTEQQILQLLGMGQNAANLANGAHTGEAEQQPVAAIGRAPNFAS